MPLHAHPGAGASAVDVRECVAQVLRMMQRLHAAQELDWTLEDRATGPVRWRGERADLEEVLGNLLDNAGKWAASRVRLTLSAEPAAGLGRLELDVEDDGPGMTPEQLQAAGQRGVRFDESIQGSGLGLAITGQIAQAYGGRLALYHSADLRGLGVRLEMRGLIPPGAGGPLAGRPAGRCGALASRLQQHDQRAGASFRGACLHEGQDLFFWTSQRCTRPLSTGVLPGEPRPCRAPPARSAGRCGGPAG